MDQAHLYIALACAFGLFMAWGIGANDVSNAMSTSVGSRAITIRQAIIIAAIFEFAGAVLAGGEVTSTIRQGLIDTSRFAASSHVLLDGMLASLLAAGTWLLIASWRGWPVSTTHTLVGAIIGFGVTAMGASVVRWESVGTIVSSWVVSPVLAGIVAFVLFVSVQKLVLDTADPLRAAIRWVPAYIFLTLFVTALVTLLKGLRHVGLDLGTAEAYGYAAAISLVGAAVGRLLVQRLDVGTVQSGHGLTWQVEKAFSGLMVVTACAMAFAHGSNDVANAVGPMSAVISVAQSGSVAAQAAVPSWALLLGGIGIVIGLMTFGRRVIATVGTQITDLTPSRGFAATLAAAAVVVVGSGTGLPLSTTHTLVGAILGVGLARGIAALNLIVIRNIFMSWIVTLPAGALLAIVYYKLLSALL